MAGIIGAKRGTGAKADGIDGLNPFTELIGLTIHPSMFTITADTLDAFAVAPDIEIVNLSLGFGWTRRSDGTRRGLTPEEHANAELVAEALGRGFAQVAAAYANVLFVASAGNDYGLVDANISSPMGYAGLALNATNIVVVGSHAMGTRSPFSNPGSQVLAPGEDVLSTIAGNGYDVFRNAAGTEQVVLRRGLGAGSFADRELVAQGAVFWGLPTRPVELGDLNGDGLLDLVQGTTLRVALPGGQFDAPQLYAGSGLARIADVNGDGKPDRIGVAGNALQVLLHR